MTDQFEQIEQTAALAATVAGAFNQAFNAILPPPAHAPLAHELYGLGVRVHPELATKELSEPHGPQQLGGWRPQTVQNITHGGDPLDIIRQFNPDLAERIAAAKTDAERAALREELRFKHGSRIADLEQQIRSAKPEDLQ